MVASNTEVYLQKYIAPALISWKGKTVVILLFSALTAVCVVKLFDIKTYFSMELFVNEEFGQYSFLQARNTHFGLSYKPTTYVQLAEINDLDLEQLQLQQVMFDEQLQRCETCSTKWFKPNSIDSWAVKFRGWMDRGKCPVYRGGVDPFLKTLMPDVFQFCLYAWMNNDKIGRTYQIDLKIEDDKLLGWKQQIETIIMNDSGSQAVDYFADVRAIEKTFGISNTYSYDDVYPEFETYSVLGGETLKQILLALLVVFLVVLFVTVSLQATLIVTFVVILVNLYVVTLT